MTDSRDLEGVWTVLGTRPPLDGVAAVDIGVHVAAGELMAGVDASGNRHLLVPLMAGEPAGTDTRGRAVQLRRLVHDGRQYLTVVCLRPELAGVFSQFSRELISSIDEVSSPAKAVVEALGRWRELFSEAGTPSVLDEHALIGLLGEMLAVEDVLAAGALGDLRFWAGPSGSVHDLRTDRVAVEVKATLAREGRFAKISSVDQLAAPEGASLTLRHCRLERDPRGIDIPGMVDRLVGAGALIEPLERRLSDVGVSPIALEAYGNRKYRVIETRHYDVLAPGFPRITRDSFVHGQVPPGTLRLNYEVDLTNEPPYPMDEDAVAALHMRLAEDTCSGMDS